MPDDNCCYLCNECPKTYASLNELQWHLSKDHLREKPPPNKSDFSDKFEDSNKNESKIKEEMLIPEEEAMEIMASSSDFSSSSADERLNTPPETPTKTTVNGITSYSCLKCTRIFSCRDQLNIHYTHTHRDKPQYVCEVCEKVFGVKRELSTHLRIHSGEQPHRCIQCGKEFGTKQLLKKHNMWHNGERSHKGHLTQHLMIHKGGRPHQCRLCEKTFIFKFDLNRHMKIHAERGHACPNCGKCFPKKTTLDEHIIKCNNKKLSPETRNSCSPKIKTRSPYSPQAKRAALTVKTTPLSSPTNENISNISTNKSLNESLPKPSHNEMDISKMAKLLMAQQFLQQQQQQIQTQQHQNFVAQNLNNLMKLHTPNQFSAINAMARPNPSLMFPMPIKSNQSFHCFICNKTMENQAAYMLHWSIVHMKPNELDLKNSENFSQKMLFLKADETNSETATSSSCASSPQKASPIATSQIPLNNPSNGILNLSANETLESTQFKTLPNCQDCDATRGREMSLSQKLTTAQAENERLKLLLQQVASSILTNGTMDGANLANALFGTTGTQVPKDNVDKFWMI